MQDAPGFNLSGATAEAVDLFGQGVRAFALAYRDAAGLFDAALGVAPRFAMAKLGKCWMFALANDALVVGSARALLAETRTLELTDPEKTHVAALMHAVEGHRGAAVALLDRHLMTYPFDLLAHYAAMLLDAFQGRFPAVRDRSARALPRWSKSQPNYGILLSFYSFGLEEAGNYERAEETARAAAELEPFGYWPHHAVSHVLEMTGRPDEGLAWMAAREPFWSTPDNVNRVHIWWHKALYHIELGQHVAALDIYDGPILTTQKPFGISLTNATALLWRLETLGCAAGNRWEQLAGLWKDHADGRLCVFADVHAAMTALRADRYNDVERLLTAMQATAADNTESAPVYRDVGLPVVRGLMAYHRGAYGQAVEHLLPARVDLWKLGGSFAQRDVIDWTLTEAATRAGQSDVALSLTYERMGARPESVPNRRFLRQAEAIGSRVP